VCRVPRECPPGLTPLPRGRATDPAESGQAANQKGTTMAANQAATEADIRRLAVDAWVCAACGRTFGGGDDWGTEGDGDYYFCRQCAEKRGLEVNQA